MRDTHPTPGQNPPFRLSPRSLAALILLFGLAGLSLVNAIRYFTPEKLVPKLLNEDRDLALDSTTRYFNSFACLLGDLPHDQIVGFWSPIASAEQRGALQQNYRMAQYAVAPVRLDAVGAAGPESAPGQIDQILFDAMGIDSIKLNSESDYQLIIAYTPENEKSGLSPLPGYTLLTSCGGGIYLVSREAEP